jgi:uncharacterized membrane protein HdeD (DUF308 family)
MRPVARADHRDMEREVRPEAGEDDYWDVSGRHVVAAAILFVSAVFGVVLMVTGSPDACGPRRTSDTWNAFAYGFGILVAVGVVVAFKRRRVLAVVAGLAIGAVALGVVGLAVAFAWISNCAQ